jgi:hypothetical protein
MRLKDGAWGLADVGNFEPAEFKVHRGLQVIIYNKNSI